MHPDAHALPASAAAALGPAFTLVLVTLVGCDVAAILVLLALNGLFLGAQYTGNSINLLLLAPNFSGTMLGISNTFANGAGIAAPYAVGLLTNGNVSEAESTVRRAESRGAKHQCSKRYAVPFSSSGPARLIS